MLSLETCQEQFQQHLDLLRNGLKKSYPGVYGEISNSDFDCIINSAPLKNSLNDSEQISIEKNWWGFSIVMNEKLTQDVINGVIASGPLATAIAAAMGAAGVVTGGIATAIGAAFAAAFALKTAEIKMIDNGNGVKIPVTWIQLAAVLASVPTGPAGIIAAIMVFIHPIRN